VVSVVPGSTVTYEIQFVLREAQIAGQDRAEQTALLYLNDLLVDSRTFTILDPDGFGTFSGSFVVEDELLSLRVLALRPLGRGTGFGQILIDNVCLRGFTR
jgi:hypothetical protein